MNFVINYHLILKFQKFINTYLQLLNKLLNIIYELLKKKEI